MKRFEHEIVSGKNGDYISEYDIYSWGDKGWQLVSVQWSSIEPGKMLTAIFCREILEKEYERGYGG